MSDGENNESPQKEEVPMEQSGEEVQSEENKADVSTESKEDLTDAADNEVEPAESEDTTASDSPSKKSPAKKVPKKKPEYEYIEDDGERLGLLERPVIIESGKREKRKVERLEITGTLTPNVQKAKIEVPEGSGEKLGDCPRIEHQLQRSRGEDMKVLHRILFGRVAPVGMVKKNIRLFCGFSFTKENKEFDKKLAVVSKLNMAVIRNICEVLDVERTGLKEDVVKRLMEFLLHPKSTGKNLPGPKKRKRSGKGNDQKGVKQKESSGKKAKAASKDKSAEGSGSDVSPDEDEESEPDEKGDAPEEDEVKKEVSEEEEDSEEEAPKKKKQKTEKTPKKQKAVKETKKEKPEKKTKEKVEKKVKEKPEKKVKEKPEKKVKKAASPKKQKASKAAEIDDDSSEDDEPLAKKQSNEPPSDEDVKECIKKILEGANLEEVTMKTVLKQVYETYPLFDLSDRKTFIKTTVKQLIS